MWLPSTGFLIPTVPDLSSPLSISDLSRCCIRCQGFYIYPVLDVTVTAYGVPVRARDPLLMVSTRGFVAATNSLLPAVRSRLNRSQFSISFFFGCHLIPVLHSCSIGYWLSDFRVTVTVVMIAVVMGDVSLWCLLRCVARAGSSVPVPHMCFQLLPGPLYAPGRLHGILLRALHSIRRSCYIK
jgi:hypothetical protein